MRFFKTSLIALVASLAFVSAEEAAPETVKSDVVDLTAESFPEFVSSTPISLIEFFAPWCGHCKALAPEYEIAATTLKEKHSVPIAKVDCTVEEALCSEQGVKGFPTLKVFRDGKPVEYKGPRKADGIIEYMKKQARPSLQPFYDQEKVAAFIKDETIAVVGFFDNDKSKQYKAFIQVAHNLRDDFSFAASFDDASLAEYDVTPNTIVIFKPFDNKKDVMKFDDDKTPLELSEEQTTFIKENGVPLMGEIGPENYSEYVDRGLPIAYLFYSSPEERAEYGEEIEAVAKNYKGKISFVYIDAEKYASHAQNLNIKQSWPAFGIQEPVSDSKFAYDGEVNEKAIGDFVKIYMSGELKPTLKSAQIPATNDEPVKVVVGESFNSIVLDSKKDVLIEVYAPWCGHCKALAPAYEEAAEKLAANKGIVIAKMDGTENDLPPSAGFKVQGFPTIKLFTAKDNKIIDFDGERTANGILEFLKKNAVNGSSIKIPSEEEEKAEDKKEEKVEEKKEEKVEEKKEEKVQEKEEVAIDDEHEEL